MIDDRIVNTESNVETLYRFDFLRRLETLAEACVATGSLVITEVIHSAMQTGSEAVVAATEFKIHST